MVLGIAPKVSIMLSMYVLYQLSLSHIQCHSHTSLPIISLLANHQSDAQQTVVSSDTT